MTAAAAAAAAALMEIPSLYYAILVLLVTFKHARPQQYTVLFTFSNVDVSMITALLTLIPLTMSVSV